MIRATCNKKGNTLAEAVVCLLFVSLAIIFSLRLRSVIQNNQIKAQLQNDCSGAVLSDMEQVSNAIVLNQNVQLGNTTSLHSLGISYLGTPVMVSLTENVSLQNAIGQGGVSLPMYTVKITGVAVQSTSTGGQTVLSGTSVFLTKVLYYGQS